MFLVYNKLMKKRVAVVGALNIDIIANSKGQLIPYDSNIGEISYNYGGVGKNVANNLARLNVEVEFISILGKDQYYQDIIKHFEQENIGLNCCEFSENSNSVYISVGDQHGDMYVAISDMSLADEMNVKFIERKMTQLNSFDIIVVDTNLPKESLEFLCKNCRAMIYADGVSTSKVKKLENCLSYLYGFKPNKYEAEALVGPNNLVKKLLDLKVKEVYVTCGADDVIYGTENKVQQLAPIIDEIVGTNGCGDSFLAGIVYGSLMGCDITEKVKLGLLSASINMASEKNISDEFCESKLLELWGKEQ